MNIEDVDLMESGKELDAAIAEHVFNFQVRSKKTWFEYKSECSVSDADYDGEVYHYRSDCMECWDQAWWPVFHYSTDISCAWEIVEVFRRGWNKHAAAVINLAITDDVSSCDCYCDIGSPDLRDQNGIGREMPEAICRAALKVALSVKNASAI